MSLSSDIAQGNAGRLAGISESTRQITPRAQVSLEIDATSNTNRRSRTMKSFWLNGYSGRQERWALDGHRWVAAEPRRNGFDLWGYQDDTPEIVYLGSGANEVQLEKLADEFLLGDPQIINPAFIL